MEAFELDLSSLDSVRNFAQKISAKNVPINVLINNAGIMFGPRRESKVDYLWLWGFESLKNM